MSMILVIVVVLCIVVWNIENNIEQKEEQEEEKKSDLIRASNDVVMKCLDDLQTTSSVSSFVTSWNTLKKECDKLVLYKGFTSDSNTKNNIDDLYKSVQEMNDDYQWLLCNVIERMRNKAVKEIKNVYKYSPENKERVIRSFQDEINQGYESFSDETKTLADKMLEEVVLIAGTRDLAQNNLNVQTVVHSKEFDFENTRLKDVDSMDGLGFEFFCADLLRANGYSNVEVTKGSGDQGVDIIATKDEIKYAIQCKCYSSDVGNKPIQEVYSGKRIYNCHVGVVLTNSFFTDGAKEAAKATGVLLWDRRKLQKLIDNKVNVSKSAM